MVVAYRGEEGDKRNYFVFNCYLICYFAHSIFPLLSAVLILLSRRGVGDLEWKLGF